MTTITEEQFDGIKYFIILSNRGVGKLARRLLMYLMDKSEMLTKPVCVTITENEEISAEEIKAINSDIGSLSAVGAGTMINELIRLTGSKFEFSRHFGYMNETGFHHENQFSFNPESDKMNYTFWLSPTDNDRDAHQLPFDLNEIKATKLFIPRLENWGDSMIENKHSVPEKN